MSTMRVIYTTKVEWPATDNHPDPVRYEFEHPGFGELYVDAIGGEPTLAKIDAVFER
jgi:hypothetical protein